MKKPNSLKKRILSLGMGIGVLFSILLIFTGFHLISLNKYSQIYAQDNLELALAIGRMESIDREQERLIRNLLEEVATPPQIKVSSQDLSKERNNFKYFSLLMKKQYKEIKHLVQSNINSGYPPEIDAGYSSIERVIDVYRRNSNRYIKLVEQVFDRIKNGHLDSAKVLYDDLESADERLGGLINELEALSNSIQIRTRDNLFNLQRFFLTLIVMFLLVIFLFWLFGRSLAHGIIFPLRKASEITSKIADGKRDIQFEIEAPVEFDSLFHSINNMLSSINEAEQLSATHAARLKDSNKEMSTFSHRIAHDLKNPLGTALGLIELMVSSDEELEPQKRAEILERIKKVLRHMTLFINDLLDYSQVDSALQRTEMVDLNQAINQVFSNLQPMIQASQASIRVDVLPQVQAKEGLSVQVFQNLISNAIKYRSEASPIIEITTYLENSRHIVCVKDNGEGISPGVQKQIFKMFYQQYGTVSEGHGIGLATVKSIMQKLGGDIWVESAKGEGSRFYLSFMKPSELKKSNTFSELSS